MRDEIFYHIILTTKTQLYFAIPYPAHGQTETCWSNNILNVITVGRSNLSTSSFNEINLAATYRQVTGSCPQGVLP